MTTVTVIFPCDKSAFFWLDLIDSSTFNNLLDESNLQDRIFELEGCKNTSKHLVTSQEGEYICILPWNFTEWEHKDGEPTKIKELRCGGTEYLQIHNNEYVHGIGKDYTGLSLRESLIYVARFLNLEHYENFIIMPPLNLKGAE